MKKCQAFDFRVREYFVIKSRKDKNATANPLHTLHTVETLVLHNVPFLLPVPLL